MTIRVKNRNGLWGYLESVGILENGSEEDIKKAKRSYKKIYLLKYKRKQRNENPELIVNFSKIKGEYGKITSAAKKHHISPSAFLKMASLAYLDKTFILPDKEVLFRIEQSLADCLNEIKRITSRREKYFWEQGNKVEDLERILTNVEQAIKYKLSKPPLLEEYMLIAIKRDPTLKEKLIALLSTYDSQNPISQTPNLSPAS